MEVFFASPKLAKLLRSRRDCAHEYGAENAKLIDIRLQNLSLARNLAEFYSLVSSLHELRGDRAGQLSFRLRGAWRMILVPADEPPPRKADGGLDWTKIESVVVVSVEDYHD